MSVVFKPIVVITRPELENDALNCLLQHQGITVHKLPLLRFKPADWSATFKAQVLPLSQWNGVISISPRASREGLRLLQTVASQGWGTNCINGFPKQLSWITIGQASATILEQHGIGPVITPKQGIDSEGLLQLNCLQGVQDQNWLLLSGNKGRTLIHDTLIQRGCAKVLKAVCYHRLRPTYCVEQLRQALCLNYPATSLTIYPHNTAPLVVVTSVQSIKHLTEYYKKLLTSDTLQRLLYETPLLVVGPRQNHYAAELGWRKIIQSSSASNQTLAQCILRWFNSPC